MRLSPYSAVFVLLLSACDIFGSGSGSGDSNDDILIGSDNSSSLTNADAINRLYVTPVGVEECSVEDIQRRVEFDMADYYVFYDSVPTLNRDDYETPEQYIRDLRVDPDIYSGIADASTQASLFGAGETQGYGFFIDRTDEDLARIRDVALGSSVESSGALRGDEVIEINGVPYLEVIESGRFGEFFPAEIGNVANVLLRTGTEEPRLVEWTHGIYTLQTAGPSQRYSTTANPNAFTVGYLPVRRFLETTRGEIDAAFDELIAGGDIEELILDLRYNGGGRTDVANHLASIIGGDAVANQISTLFRFNDKYANQNFFTQFENVTRELNLSRVIVLTTGNSASASELVISSLRAYTEVVVIGNTTEGKAFFSSSREYCGKAINAMSGTYENALGETVIGGLEPTCVVDDTWFFPTTSVNDALLGTALTYASGNSCGAMLASSSDALTRSAQDRTSVGQGDIPQTDLLILP